MKKAIVWVLALCMIGGVYAQETKTEKKEETETEKTVKEKGKTEVKIVDKDFVTIIEEEDTLQVNVGKRGVKAVDIIDLEDEDDNVTIKRKKKFRGHWGGFEIGLNNFLDKDFAFGPAAGDEFMDLHTGKSWNVNLNVMEFNVGLIGNSVGLVTGLGFEFNDYRFDNPITLVKDELNNNVIIPFDYTVEFVPAIYPTKSKLSTTYITVPLILEFQVPSQKKKNRFFISGGVIGGLKVGSHTKVVYRDEGSKQKDKVRDDFNLSPFRYGVTARIGMGPLNLFGNYYFTPLFENNKGPELYPFSIGLRFGG